MSFWGFHGAPSESVRRDLDRAARHEREERAKRREAERRAQQRWEEKVAARADEIEAKQRAAAEAEPRDRVTVLQERVEAMTRPPTVPQKWPSGHLMLGQAARTLIVEREQDARREREVATGLPRARAAWEQRRDEIEATRRVALAQADADCANAKQAAHEEAAAARAELGECPTLESIEKVTL